MKTVLTALCLTVIPALAMAEGCGWSKMDASSCIPGYTWDAASETCIPVTTS